jgi:hypothetical protein
MELLVSREQDLLRLGVRRFDRDAVPDRAGLDALGLVERADALGAALLRDQIDAVASGNRLIGAGRLAVFPVNAGFGDDTTWRGSFPDRSVPRRASSRDDAKTSAPEGL